MLTPLCRKCHFAGAAFVALAILLSGCTGSRESGDDGERQRSARVSAQNEGLVQMTLAPPVSEVRTRQLYPSGEETSVPMIVLNSGQTLTLAFDLMAGLGRPLSVYFYHADRNWKQDLLPSQFLASYYSDELVEYSSSRATEVRYVHYRYRFPNQNINFLVSGNYILRVTEQGREDEVLFEKPFFISEEAIDANFEVRPLMVGGGLWSAAQPFLRFFPSARLSDHVYDYHVCFARNARFDLARCSRGPSLMESPALLFYLPHEGAFEAEEAYRVLDLRSLRPGGPIVRAEMHRSPYRMIMETDYARLAGSIGGIFLNGQPVISDNRDVPDPHTMGEYVRVVFRYVPPDDRPLAGPVLVLGSFNSWNYDPENRLEWDAAEGRYEGEVLIKQGLYEYRYHSPELSSPGQARRLLPGTRNLYTALVYYADAYQNTDRLIAVRNVMRQ